MKKTGSAEWKGGIKDGGGTISTETGVLKNAPYGFKSRFEDGPGTNPGTDQPISDASPGEGTAEPPAS